MLSSFEETIFKSIDYNIGTATHRVRPWGDPIMVKNYGCTVSSSVPSNFQVVPLYIPDSGTWSAVTNHVRLGRTEMDFLMSLQSSFGSPENKFNERMNWLVSEGTGTRPYWGGDWKTDISFRYGTMLWGNQTIQVIGSATFKTSTPSNSKKRTLEMAEVRMFTKQDFQKALQGLITPITNPELMPQCSAVGSNNKYNPTPKGFTMFSPIWGSDWSVNLTKTWYIPFECLIEL